jgi:FKBP-type peptidyl-prolyl cis-trans isomerase FkpA
MPETAWHAALLFLLLAATAACDFGSNSSSSPTAPDQSNVAFSTTDLTVGTGAEATNGTTATVQYGAWLYSDSAPDHKGTQIDQNQISFVVGANQIIKGFDQGVVGMKVGGTRRVIVPPSLAYGAQGFSRSAERRNVFDMGLTNVVRPVHPAANGTARAPAWRSSPSCERLQRVGQP